MHILQKLVYIFISNFNNWNLKLWKYFYFYVTFLFIGKYQLLIVSGGIPIHAPSPSLLPFPLSQHYISYFHVT